MTTRMVSTSKPAALYSSRAAFRNLTASAICASRCAASMRMNAVMARTLGFAWPKAKERQRGEKEEFPHGTVIPRARRYPLMRAAERAHAVTIALDCEVSTARSAGRPCFGHPGLPVRTARTVGICGRRRGVLSARAAWHCGADRACCADVCCLLGALLRGRSGCAVHAPGPPPTDRCRAAARSVILGGCVVEPPAVSGERERFMLELDRDARAQVTLYTKPGETLPSCTTGRISSSTAKLRPPRNFGNPGAFDYRRFLARQDIYWTASAAGGHRARAARTLRQSRFRRP